MRLEMRGLTRRFGSFTANDHIDLTIEPGEIHCLLGENGAGKSTLMNMLYGLLEPTEGEILLDGEPVRFATPGDAIDAGIGMVHQHFMLVPVFTVAENVMLGREQTHRFGVLDRGKAAERRAAEQRTDDEPGRGHPEAVAPAPLGHRRDPVRRGGRRCRRLHLAPRRRLLGLLRIAPAAGRAEARDNQQSSSGTHAQSGVQG